LSDLREVQIRALREAPLDVLVLGGGINGAGVARDLALRAEGGGTRLRIGLIERGQFGSGTSGRNSQLIHGGLRYLKQLQFGLVREALRERAALIRLAPDLVRPLRFLMPFYGAADRFYYGAGLALYDLLAGRQNIAQHRRLGRSQTLAFEPGLGREGLRGGAVFWDAQVHAARLVLANVFDAVRHGAAAANYLRAAGWSRSGPLWRVEVADELSGERFELRARKLVDTLGPWSPGSALRLVRGSHIVLPRLTAGDHAVAEFNRDGRIVFVMPWGETRPLSLVGTTDVDHDCGPDAVAAAPAEIEYLLGAVRRLFPQAGDVRPIATYSALRPLVPEEKASPSAVSREHRIWNDGAGVLHVAGGKYTIYRAMSEEAGDLVAREVAPALARVHVTARAAIAGKIARGAGAIAGATLDDMARRLSDALFVSTYRGYEQQWTAERLAPLAREMGELLGWDERRRQEEIARVLCQAA
jgi:glycerol-3-phosphate dehydrogenase